MTFYQKIFRFLHLAKKLQDMFLNKNAGFLFFLTVLESYNKSFMPKNLRKIISHVNHSGKEE